MSVFSFLSLRHVFGNLKKLINHQRVREERQNLDLAGHYSRPDILQLKVDRERQKSVINANQGSIPSPILGEIKKQNR